MSAVAGKDEGVGKVATGIVRVPLKRHAGTRRLTRYRVTMCLRQATLHSWPPRQSLFSNVYAFVATLVTRKDNSLPLFAKGGLVSLYGLASDVRRGLDSTARASSDPARQNTLSSDFEKTLRSSAADRPCQMQPPRALSYMARSTKSD